MPGQGCGHDGHIQYLAVCLLSLPSAHSRIRAHSEAVRMTATGWDGSHRVSWPPQPRITTLCRRRRTGRDTGTPSLGRTVPPRLTAHRTRPHTLTMYSMRLWECFSITDSIQIKGLTCRESRRGTHTWPFHRAPFHRGEPGAQAQDRRPAVSPGMSSTPCCLGLSEEPTVTQVRPEHAGPGSREMPRVSVPGAEKKKKCRAHHGPYWSGSREGAVRPRGPGPSQSLGLQTQGSWSQGSPCARPGCHLVGVRLILDSNCPNHGQEARARPHPEPPRPLPSGERRPHPRAARCTHVGVETVGHELEFAVGWDEGDGAVVLEAGESHTLVELHVLQLH